MRLGVTWGEIFFLFLSFFFLLWAYFFEYCFRLFGGGQVEAYLLEGQNPRRQAQNSHRWLLGQLECRWGVDRMQGVWEGSQSQSLWDQVDFLVLQLVSVSHSHFHFLRRRRGGGIELELIGRFFYFAFLWN